MTPLSLHPENPRYFADGAGRAVYLTGSHHWDSLQDNAERPGGLDFESYLDRLDAWGHNFIRLWALEAWTYDVRPLPWLRTGSRYDLSRWNPEYFERLRQRVARAGERSFYVSVMLWNGWSLHDKGEGNPWFRHPFNRLNNVNGIDGDPDARGDGADVHTLRIPAITRLQERYAEKVVETVGEFDYVLWEISNESPGESVPWQLHMIRHLKTVLGVRHPVGMTFPYPGGNNESLFASPADWISPGRKSIWMKSPPPADGRKVVLLDTDHLWGIGGGRDWIWKTFLRGHHPIYMDPLDDDPVRIEARRAMGDTLRLARGIDLAAFVPNVMDYSLINRTPGAEQIVRYLPRGKAKVDLRGIDGEMTAEWLDPKTGTTVDGGRVEGGKRRRLRAPFPGDAVLFLKRGMLPDR